MSVPSGTKHELMPGLIRENLHNGRIVALRVEDASPEVLDKAYLTVLEVHRDCGAERPFLLLYDVENINLTLTPYMRTLIKKLNAANPHVRGRTAVLLSKSSMTLVLQSFVRFIRSSNRPKRIFFSRSEALAWLEELL